MRRHTWLMKLTKAPLLILALGGYLLACSSPKTVEQVGGVQTGDYQYTSFDKNGAKVVEGRLSLTSVEKRRIQSEEQIQIKGNWQLNKVGNQERIGPQVGSGDLIGSIIEGELRLDLNPNISDANVILKGKIEGKRFHGTWSFKGYAGTISEGTFEAIRK